MMVMEVVELEASAALLLCPLGRNLRGSGALPTRLPLPEIDQQLQLL
jgi:hypothetical protein